MLDFPTSIENLTWRRWRSSQFPWYIDQVVSTALLIISEASRLTQSLFLEHQNYYFVFLLRHGFQFIQFLLVAVRSPSWRSKGLALGEPPSVACRFKKGSCQKSQIHCLR